MYWSHFKNFFGGTKPIFKESGPRPILSSSRNVRPYIYMYLVSLPLQFLQGLSLALISYDQFNTFHWSIPIPPPHLFYIIFFLWYQFYHLHQSRDSLSSVCGNWKIIFRLLFYILFQFVQICICQKLCLIRKLMIFLVVQAQGMFEVTLQTLLLLYACKAIIGIFSRPSKARDWSTNNVVNNSFIEYVSFPLPILNHWLSWLVL